MVTIAGRLRNCRGRAALGWTSAGASPPAAFNASVLANKTHWMNYSTHEGQRLGGLTQGERSAESSQRLVVSAIALIAEKGFENTTAAEIGERAPSGRGRCREHQARL